LTRAVLLGGSGFIGRWLTRSLKKRGREVIVLDLREPGEPVDSWVEADARDLQTVTDVIKPGDVVVHLFHSSIPTESMGAPKAERMENVVPFEQLVLKLSKLEPSLFVYSSTGGQIYGEVDSIPIKETVTCNPVSEYGRSKLRMEEITRAAHDSFPHLILRVGNPYGPYQELTNRHGVIPHLMRSVIQGRTFTVYGGGETVRDYVYVEDTAESVACLIEQGAANETVNIGSGVGISLSDLIELVKDVSGGELKTIDAEIRSSDVRLNVLDIGRLKELGGYAPKMKLEDGLRRTWEYMRAHEKA